MREVLKMVDKCIILEVIKVSHMPELIELYTLICTVSYMVLLPSQKSVLS